jgi:hypothetical protein
LCASLAIACRQEYRFWVCPRILGGHIVAASVCVPGYCTCTGTLFLGASLEIARALGRHFWLSPWVLRVLRCADILCVTGYCAHRDAGFWLRPWIMFVGSNADFTCDPGYCARTEMPFLECLPGYCTCTGSPFASLCVPRTPGRHVCVLPWILHVPRGAECSVRRLRLRLHK